MSVPLILLGSCTLHLVTHPSAGKQGRDCQNWMYNLLSKGFEVAVPEISDYETRMQLILLQHKRPRHIIALDSLVDSLTYLPLTTDIMRKAAELWAQVRRKGKPTADRKALDGDVILGAQAIIQGQMGRTVTVATDNVRHVAQFTDARLWSNIP